MSGAYEAMQERRFHQQERLLELPDQLQDCQSSIRELQDEFSLHAEQIEELRANIDSANSWRSKWKDYVIGGLVGASIALLISLLTGI